MRERSTSSSASRGTAPLGASMIDTRSALLRTSICSNVIGSREPMTKIPLPGGTVATSGRTRAAITEASVSARPRAPMKRSTPSACAAERACLISSVVRVSGIEQRRACLPSFSSIAMAVSTPKPETAPPLTIRPKSGIAGTTRARRKEIASISAAICPFRRESIFLNRIVSAGTSASSSCVRRRASSAFPSRHPRLTLRTAGAAASAACTPSSPVATSVTIPRPAKGAAASSAPVRSSAKINSTASPSKSCKVLHR